MLLKNTACECVFFLEKTYNMSRSLYTQKLLFNLNRSRLNQRATLLQNDSIARNKLIFGQKNNQRLLPVDSLSLLKFICSLGLHQLTWKIFQFPVSAIIHAIYIVKGARFGNIIIWDRRQPGIVDSSWC